MHSWVEPSECGSGDSLEDLSQVRWDFEQFDLVKGVPAHGKMIFKGHIQADLLCGCVICAHKWGAVNEPASGLLVSEAKVWPPRILTYSFSLSDLQKVMPEACAVPIALEESKL